MNTLKQKQDALMTLLEESILLSYEQKLDVINIFPTLTEEQIDALGAFLAAEERIREEFPEEIQKGVESVLTDIVGEQVTMPSDDNKVYIGTGRPQ
jgi:hypothetical protein